MSGANGFPDFFELRRFGKNEDERFLRFLKILEDEAWRQGSVFFIDSAEGNDFIGEDIDCCDLWGWLVATDVVLEFEPLWRRDAWGFDARFNDVSCRATWEGDPLRPETIKVNFDMLEDERFVR